MPALFSILFSTSCSKKNQVDSPLDGIYVGTLAAEWERIGIKNFQTKPDTTYASGKFVVQDVKLVLQGNTYTFSAPVFATGAIGNMTVKGDSISFGTSPCSFHACSEYLAGEQVRFLKNNDSLEMTFKLEKYERQYNLTDKDITTEKRVYSLKKLD
jgi:hypothetical protein